MYNKFSVIEFTSNTSTPRRNTSPVDSSSNSSSSNSSNNQLNTGQMPKKRGRPAKTTPSTQMVIKTTECIFQPIVFSMQAKKPDSWIANLNSKRKFTEDSETIHRSNYFELEDSYRTNNELASMQRKVKVSNTNTIAETERREKINQREWMTRCEQSVSKIEPSHTKPRIIRTKHVGKSKIIKEYIRDLRWKPSDRNTSRVRADIGEEVYHFDICDGIDGFSEVKTLETFMNAAALVIVLSLDKSVTNSKPFIEDLLNRIENMKSIRPLIIPIVFVINKIDITKTKSSIEDVRGLCQELIQSHNFVNTSIVENRTEQDIPKIFSNIANQLEWDDLLLEKIIELDVKLFHHVEEPKEKREALEESERNQEEELEPHRPILTKKQPETLMEKEVVNQEPVANNSPKKKKSSKNCIIN